MDFGVMQISLDIEALRRSHQSTDDDVRWRAPVRLRTVTLSFSAEFVLSHCALIERKTSLSACLFFMLLM
jgi:hypothetical protein